MRSAARHTLVATVLAVVALASTVSAGASAQSCGARELSQPFLPWLDPAHYFLLPGGDFEATSPWTLTGGAKIVPGNETHHVGGASDSRSLLVPSGGSARSTPECVDGDELTLRFFAQSTGSPLSALVVEARIRSTVLGVTAVTTLPLGVVLGTQRSWQPSLPVVFALSANQLAGGTTTVDFRFTPIGIGGSWLVDDVYVDPFKDRGAS